MRKTLKFGRMKSTRDRLTLSHRQRVIEELRSPDVAAEYLKAAAEDGDPRVYSFGSITSRVLANADRPVMVYR